MKHMAEIIPMMQKEPKRGLRKGNWEEDKENYKKTWEEIEWW